MKRLVPKILLAAALLTGGPAVLAQKATLYTPVPTPVSAALKATYGACRLVRQDIPTLLAHVRRATAAAKGAGAARDAITVPLPDGRDEVFALSETALLAPELAAENPDLHTFRGVSADGRYTLSLTTSPMGMIGMVQGDNEVFYFTPRDNRNPEELLVYDAKMQQGLPGLQCGVTEMGQQLAGRNTPLFRTTHGDGNIRTYRMAVACTGEYTTWAGSQSNALTQITATINAVTAIYERELAIHFTLVCPTTIRFTNANTDPYTQGDVSSTTLGQNQTTLDNTSYLGSANYDLGIVLTAASSGGLARKPSACNSSFKGQSASGLDPASFPSGPSGPVFIVTVAHETGHQFNASHSFAANTGGCNNNTSGSTGWEPGGGSTIMAYAGTCTGLAYQQDSDPYFHTGNLLEMSSYMINPTGGGACGSTTTNANAALTATVPGGNAFIIPVSTPFRLRANTTQVENNTLTYAFDQYDTVGGSGTSAAPAAGNTTGPMFRSFPPGTNNTQYFPSLAALVGINSAAYEVLPSVARNLNFRYTVRDNVAYTASTAGRTANGAVTVTTVACAKPFAVTSQSTSGSFVSNGSNKLAVTWDTASSCATCTKVNIRFSRDGGRSFPYILTGNTANDGLDSVVVPNLPTDRGRILVECVDNIHFNINSAAQTITSSCAAEGTSFAPATDLYVSSAGNASLNQTLTPVYGTAITTPLSGNITAANDSGSLTIYNGGNCVTYGNVTKYASFRFTPGASGSYTFTRTSGSNITMNLYDSSVLLSAQCRNLIAGDFTAVTANLSKNKVYTLVVAYYGSSSTAPYTISVNGGVLYTAVPGPGAGFNYSYVIVANATGLIKAIQATGDMSNSTAFPAGGYTVRGVSSSSTAAALNSAWAGQSFAAFSNAAQNQTGGLCASLSANARRVGIATATPAVLLSFDGRLTDRRKALLYWEAGTEEGLQSFDLERSYDNISYEFAGRVLPVNALNGAYQLTDGGIAGDATQVFYRLKLREANGQDLYSGTVRFKLDGMQPGFSVAPNPVAGGVLRATVTTAAAGDYELVVYDLAGRRLLTERRSLQAGLNAVTVAVADLAPGLYLVQLEGGALRIAQRFVKP